MRPPVVVDQASDAFAHFTYRVLLDAYLEGTAAYWRRRAGQLEAARPAPGEYTGTATREQLSEQWQRLTAAAEACRNRADFLDASRAQFDETLTELGGAA